MMQRSRHASLRAFMHDERGATAIEYALIASMVSIVIAGAAMGIGSALVDNYYNKIGEAFD